ncbi:MAG: NIPSNAP family protein [Chitinophagaceae bacterium]|nr:NIPSNAP family protein [Rubrivivax sp.]
MTPPICSVIELRQYTMQPGRRDELVSLFEREFIETQAAEGLHVRGIFRDADRPDRFVWLRGCTDMAARGAGLAAFYDGPVWRRHRHAANATMVDSSDVLLLRPLTDWPVESASGRWQMQVFRTDAAADAVLGDAMRRSGLCWLATEPAPNNFPRHPIREGEQVVVALAPGQVVLLSPLREILNAPVQTLNLLPTPASPLQ